MHIGGWVMSKNNFLERLAMKYRRNFGSSPLITAISSPPESYNKSCNTEILSQREWRKFIQKKVGDNKSSKILYEHGVMCND